MFCSLTGIDDIVTFDVPMGARYSHMWSYMYTCRSNLKSVMRIEDTAVIKSPYTFLCVLLTVMFWYIKNIDISYLIARGNVTVLNIPVSTSWCIILPNFHLWCQQVVNLSSKLKLNLSSWQNFVQFYITTYLSEFQKAVISRMEPCLLSTG